MHLQLALLAVSALLASCVSAAPATLKIEVGADGQLLYTPNTRTAAVGDILEFHFNPKNHSVVQSSFAAPCVPLAGGFFSGFVPVTAGEGPTVFHVTVADLKPIWYYCAQTVKAHCQSGMVGAINAPATGNTFALFQTNAAKTNVSISPAVVQGGGFAPNPNFTSIALTTTSVAVATSTVTSATLRSNLTISGNAPSQTITIKPTTATASNTASAPSATASKSEGAATKSFRLAQVVVFIGCIWGMAIFL